MLLFFRPAFERYSVAARQAVFWALREAKDCGDRCLTPEHLVLGLVRQDPDAMRGLVRQSSIETLVDDLRRNLGSGKIKTSGDLPLSANAKAVLKAAEQLANGRRIRLRPWTGEG